MSDCHDPDVRQVIRVRTFTAHAGMCPIPSCAAAGGNGKIYHTEREIIRYCFCKKCGKEWKVIGPPAYTKVVICAPLGAAPASAGETPETSRKGEKKRRRS